MEHNNDSNNNSIVNDRVKQNQGSVLLEGKEGNKGCIIGDSTRGFDNNEQQQQVVLFEQDQKYSFDSTSKTNKAVAVHHGKQQKQHQQRQQQQQPLKQQDFSVTTPKQAAKSALFYFIHDLKQMGNYVGDVESEQLFQKLSQDKKMPYIQKSKKDYIRWLQERDKLQQKYIIQPKRQTRSAWLFFIDDQKQQGKFISRAEASKLWKQLSPVEKLPYIQKSKKDAMRCLFEKEQLAANQNFKKQIDKGDSRHIHDEASNYSSKSWPVAAVSSSSLHTSVKTRINESLKKRKRESSTLFVPFSISSSSSSLVPSSRGINNAACNDGDDDDEKDKKKPYVQKSMIPVLSGSSSIDVPMMSTQRQWSSSPPYWLPTNHDTTSILNTIQLDGSGNTFRIARNDLQTNPVGNNKRGKEDQVSKHYDEK